MIPHFRHPIAIDRFPNRERAWRLPPASATIAPPQPHSVAGGARIAVSFTPFTPHLHPLSRSASSSFIRGPVGSLYVVRCGKLTPPVPFNSTYFIGNCWIRITKAGFSTISPNTWLNPDQVGHAIGSTKSPLYLEHLGAVPRSLAAMEAK